MTNLEATGIALLGMIAVIGIGVIATAVIESIINHLRNIK